jgi:putative ubiquitin-RnfH superfamily antitoxin RatB of RatAB toxin-antitoxin module
MMLQLAVVLLLPQNQKVELIVVADLKDHHPPSSQSNLIYERNKDLNLQALALTVLWMLISGTTSTTDEDKLEIGREGGR